MTEWQVFFRVQAPLALPVVIAGVRTAAVEVIASATLAAFIGAGGLGRFITSGLTLYDFSLLLVGAIPVTLTRVERRGIPGGSRTARHTTGDDTLAGSSRKSRMRGQRRETECRLHAERCFRVRSLRQPAPDPGRPSRGIGAQDAVQRVGFQGLCGIDHSGGDVCPSPRRCGSIGRKKAQIWRYGPTAHEALLNRRAGCLP